MTKKTNFQIAEECGAVIGGGIVVFPTNKQFGEFVERIRRDALKPAKEVIERNVALVPPDMGLNC